jgi:hypothetical protein
VPGILVPSTRHFAEALYLVELLSVLGTYLEKSKRTQLPSLPG